MIKVHIWIQVLEYAFSFLRPQRLFIRKTCKNNKFYLHSSRNPIFANLVHTYMHNIQGANVLYLHAMGYYQIPGSSFVYIFFALSLHLLTVNEVVLSQTACTVSLATFSRIKLTVNSIFRMGYKWIRKDEYFHPELFGSTVPLLIIC